MELAKECFVGKEVSSSCMIGFTVLEGSRNVAYKMLGQPKIDVYVENVLLQAREFARRYEEQFPKQMEVWGEFVINSDYSENK